MYGPRKEKPRHEPPRPCHDEVYRHGEPLPVLDDYDDYDLGNWGVERWVRQLAEASGQRVDWHYVGGGAVVKYIGSFRELRKALLQYPCPGRLLRTWPSPPPWPWED